MTMTPLEVAALVISATGLLLSVLAWREAWNRRR